MNVNLLQGIISRSSSSLPLDGVSSSEMQWAISFFHLKSDYTGAGIRVRHGGTNVEQDVFFTDGFIDPADLVAIHTEVYLVTKYDQSGNGNDFSQTDPAKQPYVVKGGVAYVSPNGVLGGSHNNEIRYLTSSVVSIPKDFCSLSYYSEQGSTTNLISKGGTWHNRAAANGWYLWGYDNGLTELYARVYSSTGAILSSLNTADLVDPSKGVSACLVCDDTNGSGSCSSQEGTVTGTWIANSRNGSTSAVADYGRIWTFAGTGTQHYDVLFNDAVDRSSIKQDLETIMGN